MSVALFHMLPCVFWSCSPAANAKLVEDHTRWLHSLNGDQQRTSNNKIRSIYSGDITMMLSGEEKRIRLHTSQVMTKLPNSQFTVLLRGWFKVVQRLLSSGCSRSVKPDTDIVRTPGKMETPTCSLESKALKMKECQHFQCKQTTLSPVSSLFS